MDRRGFLCFGALTGMFFAAGCENGGGEPTAVTTPPTIESGNRKKLDKFVEKGAAIAEKTPKKKK
jgi:hypothetical protein